MAAQRGSASTEGGANITEIVVALGDKVDEFARNFSFLKSKDGR